MKKIKLVVCLCAVAAAVTIVYSQSETIRFAVSPFITLTLDAENEKDGVLASKQIESSLSSNKWFELRKSGEIESFLDKLSLAQSGVGDADAVAAEGKNLKIEYLTVGSVAKFGNDYELDSRSVDINTWMIVHSSGCSAADLDLACGFVNKDVEITLTKENLDEKLAALKDKPTLAVYKFIDSNDMAQEFGCGGAFSEILNSELGARNELGVMERTHLKSVIDAKNLEMCGVTVNDDSDGYFAVKGIAYKFEGTIKLFPGMICIGYQVINTANSRRIYVGYSEIATVKGIRPLARKIAREIDESINHKIGSVELATEPSEADITIDGQPYGKSPVVFSMPVGIHTVRASLAGYETVTKKLKIESGKVLTEKIKLGILSKQLFTEAFSAESRKQWNVALSKYEEFIKLYDDTEDANQAYYRKGHILLLYLNDKEGALKTFEALIQRYPDSMTRAEAYFGVARAYKEMGNNAKVSEVVSILRSKFPNEIATEEANAFFGM